MGMTHTETIPKKLIKYRWFFVWSFDKQEAWLNQMAADGWTLESVNSLRYRFTRTEPGAYIIRLELLDWVPQHKKSQDYIRFVKDSGAELVGSSMRWVYFRRKAEFGPFDLYSDRESRLKHLTRISNLVAFFALMELGVGLSSFATRQTTGPYFSLILILIGLLFTFGYFKLRQKKKALWKDSQLFE